MRNHFLRAGGVASSGGGGSGATSAYISGKLFYRSSGTGGFGAFWERTDGTLDDLEINPTGITAFNERTDTIQTSSGYENWLDFEIDLTGLENGRVYFYARRGSSGSNRHRADFCLDDITLHADDDTTVDFDPSSSSVRGSSEPTWECGTSHYAMDSYSEAKSELSTGPMWANVGTATANGRWQYETGDTPSTHTGPNKAADGNNGTYYVYWEASTDDGDGSWMRFKSHYNLSNGAEI